MKKFLASLLILSIFSPLLALAQTGDVGGYGSYGTNTASPTAPSAGGFISVPVNTSDANTCTSDTCGDVIGSAPT